MSASPPTIWMDVTTSATWQRPAVGIVRVERSLCTELGTLYGARFRQCVWQGDQFVECVHNVQTRVVTTTLKQEAAAATQPGRPVLPPIFPILPRKQALIALGQSLLSLMPSKLQPYFNRLFYALRPRIVRLLTNERPKRLLAKLRGEPVVTSSTTPIPAPAPPLHGHDTALFASGDVLISVGLDWDQSYYKQFYALRVHRGVKVVTCCYDLIPILYPQYCVSDVAGIFTSYFLDLADGSDLVLCISRQSEKDLNDLLDRTGGARPPTCVLRLGDNFPVAGNEGISPAVETICQTPFILYVSTIERRKNHEVLYRAYHLLCQQGERKNLPRLVFVGMQGWGVNELLKDIELDPLTLDLIVRLNHVSDAELRALYDAAQFCVYPSLYEGWGLPVGEALSMGKAVICSDRGSLPEVGRDLVRYVDPWNPQAWTEEIYRMATDDAWREEWETKARARYHQRTWHQTAVSVAAKIDRLLCCCPR